MRRAAIGCLLFLALSAFSAAEEFEFRVPATCADIPLIKGDLNAEWIKDGVEISEPAGVILTVHTGDTSYTLTGLPDVAAGVGTRYSLTFEVCGAVGVYEWPAQTRTPQPLVFAGSYETPGNPVWTTPAGVFTYGPGDTLPKIELTVGGIEDDPTGSTVTFSLGKRGATPKVDSAAATLVSATLEADGSYTAVVEYAPAATDTDTPGNWLGFFTATSPVSNCGPGGASACVSTWPPGKDIPVLVAR